ncbi:MAG: PSD1 and planctomycete cytochrome C domain-containing protein [Planctomycetales bacterium]
MRFRAFPLLSVLAVGVFQIPVQADPASEQVDFNRQIRPILADRCFRCHGPDAHHRQANLRLDTAEGARVDLGGRRPLVPGQPESSELLQRLTAADDSVRMPPPEAGKPLSTGEISLLRRWIEEGAEYQPHWSFLSPRRPAVPEVRDPHWSRNDIDRFLLSRLEQIGVAPAPPAEKVTLVRRVTFDLTGLPPTPAQVEAFVNDPDPAAFDHFVDRLLESRHFGERMAMYWLDLVRYADTVGYHGDQDHPIAPYRDWVIKAFNDNLPFDQFTIEQLAGDLLPEPTIDQKIASGYNRLLQTSHEGGVQVREYLHKYDADRIRNLGGVWMGATLGCVECHDHKFDPYTQRDYYRLVAVFADVDDLRTFRGGDSTPTKREPEIVVLSPVDREQIAHLETQAAELERQLSEEKATDTNGPKNLPDANEKGRMQQRLEGLRQQLDVLRQRTQRTMVTEAIAPKTVRILQRGDWMDETGEIVEPGVPEFLHPLNVEGRRITRLDLARWLTAPDHPQTARVFINRLWYLFFGDGLSHSLEDSGAQGDWPTHPELLDWLAVEFAAPPGNWNIKRIIRLMVTSAAYRQSSEPREELRERDPYNRWFARQSSHRLPAEMIRDNLLAASGLLVDQLGGPSAHPYQPAGYYKFLNFPTREYQADTGENQYRRGVYTHWQRTYLHPMLKALDAPSREECTARRPVSNTLLAALTLLNDPSFVEGARVFAARLLTEQEASDAERISRGWRLVLSRPADAEERAAAMRLLTASRAEFEGDPDRAEKLLSVGQSSRPDRIAAAELAAWTTLARALFNLHETITRY